MAAAVARVRRTFIEYPVKPEFMDLSFMDEEEHVSNDLRTQSDPTGANTEFAQPRKVLVPMRGVAEEASRDSRASGANLAPGEVRPPGEAAEGADEREEYAAQERDVEEEE
eukprot:CAMPEP_0204584926 /NCGR_PEP_ID=MMETSP0661-20131031/46622_1 /ASSEMBLY_ACC=CAM_ASM_000606 /TAXON_ID=109239 /ORGANISM="Alexandrium margalefi, Strain AMGDE01CS-322" /LENGTH=110 /DNA_ID=CAMNT_0051594429 /DNA_START=125 /DNA_END=454 /DNA_ORIENTATION=+